MFFAICVHYYFQSITLILAVACKSAVASINPLVDLALLPALELRVGNSRAQINCTEQFSYGLQLCQYLSLYPLDGLWLFFPLFLFFIIFFNLCVFTPVHMCTLCWKRFTHPRPVELQFEKPLLPF